jgi:protein SCO1/2
MRRTLLLLIGLLAASNEAQAQRVGVGGYGKAPAAPAREAPPPERVGIDKKHGAQVPLDLPFKDEHDNPITFGQAMDGKPVILVLAYFRCQQLCNQVLNDLVNSLRDVTYDVGDKFNVVVVSFDPKDKPPIAYGKKMSYVQQYGRPGAERGFRFLTGDQASIDALCETVGFRYEYDAKIKEYFHASGVMILSPGGIVYRYFFGLNYSPVDLRLGIADASEGKEVDLSKDKLLLLLCMRYDPHAGKYSSSVMLILRAAAALTVVIVATWVLLVWRKNRRKRLAEPVEQAVA